MQSLLETRKKLNLILLDLEEYLKVSLELIHKAETDQTRLQSLL